MVDPKRRGSARARRIMAAWALAGAAFALGGCAPEYNWRELRFTEERIAVMLPSKPAEDTRDIDLDGLKVRMSMHGARAGDNVFAVASVRLPDAQEASRSRALAAMRAQMVRNIGGTEQRASDAPVPMVDADGRDVGRVPGVRIEAQGQAQGRPAVMVARFAGEGDRVWQAIVIGPAPDREQVAVFLDSLKVLK